MPSYKPLVLTIDDDPSVGRVLELKLRAEGYRTVRVITAEDGLEKIHSLRPDVVVTDLKLPGVSGLELCRICEALQAQQPFLIIVLTSQVDRSEQDWIETSELRCHVTKPFSPRAVASIIRQYVQNAPHSGAESDSAAAAGIQPSIGGDDRQFAS